MNEDSALAIYGVSEELIGMIDALRETPSQCSSKNKYSFDDVNQLSQAIICRNYGFSCLGLSYLLVAALAINKNQPAPLESFFWIEESITYSQVRKKFSKPVQFKYGQVSISESCLIISHHLSDEECFKINLYRIKYLAVLLEFLVNVAGDVLDLAEIELTGDVGSIKSFASRLQKIIYDFIDNHMLPDHQMKRLRAISIWIKEEYQQNSMIAAINDEAILAFWKRIDVTDEGSGNIRYRSVAEGFISFYQALSIGMSKQAARYMQSIGFDEKAGDLSPEQLDGLLEAAAQVSDNNVRFLVGSPKFLTKKQGNMFEPIIMAQNVITVLPKTLLRMAVFGDWQAQLIQAKRKGYMSTRLEQPEIDNYIEFIQELSNLKEQMLNVRLAVWHILLSLKQATFLSASHDILSEQCLGQLKQIFLRISNEFVENKDDNVEYEHVFESGYEQTMELFFEQIAQVKLQVPEFNEQLKQAREAYNNIRREGFKTLPEIKDLVDYEHGSEVLAKCIIIVKKYIGELERLDIITNTSYDEDFSEFKVMFVRLYEVHR